MIRGVEGSFGLVENVQVRVVGIYNYGAGEAAPSGFLAV